MKKKVFIILTSFILIFALCFSFFGFNKNRDSLQNNISTIFKKTNIKDYVDIDTTQVETYDILNSEIENLISAFPKLIKSATFGVSETGKYIPMFTVGIGEKKALIVGSFHAREHITTKYIMCCIEDYCKAYYNDSGKFNNYDIKNLLDTYTLTIIPCLNIDGVEIITSDASPSENVTYNSLFEYKANYNGVDLNRNFPFLWDELDTEIYEPYAYYYKGSTAASEIETQEMISLCDSNDFDFAISFHIKGDCIYWDDCATEHDNSMYSYFAERISNVSGLSLTEPTTDSSMYAGAFEDWFRNTYNKPGFCIELLDCDVDISPTDNENYLDFYNVTEYENTVNIIAEAMSASIEYA